MILFCNLIHVFRRRLTCKRIYYVFFSRIQGIELDKLFSTYIKFFYFYVFRKWKHFEQIGNWRVALIFQYLCGVLSIPILLDSLATLSKSPNQLGSVLPLNTKTNTAQ